MPARDRDRVAEQALGRAGVVAERVDHHLHLATRVGDRLAGIAGLEPRWLLVVVGDGLGERVEQLRPGRGGDCPPGRKRSFGTDDSRVDLLAAGTRTSAITCSVAGSMTAIIRARTCAVARVGTRLAEG